MTHVTLEELRWFSKAVHHSRRWQHVQQLRKTMLGGSNVS